MRGSILDMIGWIVVLFVVGLAFLITGMIRDSIADPFITKYENRTDTIGDSTMNETIRDAWGNADSAIMNFNAGFVLILGGLILGSLILAYQLQTPIIFLPILIFILALVILIGGVFSNAFEDMTTTGDLADEAEEWEILTAVMSHLPLFLLVGGSLIIIVMVGVRGRSLLGGI